VTTTDKVVVAAGVLLAVGALWYWSASSPPAAATGAEMQKDLLTALRRDRRLERPVGSSATGWSAA
jgi:hypothetical protein